VEEGNFKADAKVNTFGNCISAGKVRR
jgi:hypothetical protein